MRIDGMNWMQAEAALAREDRCVLPIGSVEQHGYLSLATDAILAERVSVEAAEPLGVPVFPVLSYGFTPTFTAFPGTVSLRLETLLAVLRDVLTGLHRQGFRRILVVNGHGGNAPAMGLLAALMSEHPLLQVKFHSWWNAPRTWAVVQDVDAQSSHASWMENLPWTRIPGVVLPSGRKAPVDGRRTSLLNPTQLREAIGDGNFGGPYERPDEDVMRMWAVAVQETRELIEGPWRTADAAAT
jgi:creatinine amidohydrolase